jgi:hypothetical protein
VSKANLTNFYTALLCGADCWQLTVRKMGTAGKSFLRMKARKRNDYIRNKVGIGGMNGITKLSKERITIFGKNTGNTVLKLQY